METFMGTFMGTFDDTALRSIIYWEKRDEIIKAAYWFPIEDVLLSE